jgi:membrane-bound lytic murein transglycosylase F
MILKITRLILICLLFTGCSKEKTAEKNQTVIRDWDQIQKDSTLTILAENSPASYFVYKGKNMGYEYDLIKEFADDHNLRLKVTMVNNLDDMIHYLDSGVGDLIACNLSINEERKKLLTFTNPHLYTYQVLVQRKPANYKKLSKQALQDSLISDVSGLQNKTIHVWKNSTYYTQLMKLNTIFGLNMNIIGTEGDMVSGELIRMVSEGEIDYTVTEENVAKIELKNYANLDIKVHVSDKDSIGFGLRKTSPELKKKFDAWLKAKENESTIAEVNRTYFDNNQVTSKATKPFSSVSGDAISQYDDIIKRESEKMGWDWRLVSAIIYQESKFETYKKSWAGAFGIFQFMPATARAYGITPESSAEDQIIAGVKKLSKNYQIWLKVIPDTTESIKFTLASFNAGRPHVDDARALCVKHKLNPAVWTGNVDSMLTNLSKPTYYQDPVVKYGYCRGIETHKFIIEVLQRFEEYKAAFPDKPKE